MILAGMSIISDNMSRDNNVNNFLVMFALAEMRKSMPFTLRSLLKKKGLVTEDTLSFNIIPQLNAAQRMNRASLAFTFLMIEFDIINNINKAYEFEENRVLLEKAVEAIVSTRFDIVNINQRRKIKQRHGSEYARESLVSYGDVA